LICEEIFNNNNASGSFFLSEKCHIPLTTTPYAEWERGQLHLAIVVENFSPHYMPLYPNALSKSRPHKASGGHARSLQALGLAFILKSSWVARALGRELLSPKICVSKRGA